MKIILTFILDHCLFLFEQHGFIFIDSSCSKSFGGDAHVTLKSGELKMRFVYDRGQLLIDFMNTSLRKERWFSIDLIAQLLTGQIQQSAVMNEYYVQFISVNMPAIIDAFSQESIETTRRQLSEFAKVRADRMFGGSQSGPDS